ncbi:amidase [Phytomonospora endophytica]|uniref:Amidase n=1 Tax=Phytomonospora endophytica TaxID=714109 RepID=A0A841FT59_9ACTN|nr:amidase family protein [Phytomonospora endophytica]MBB6036497.1 amidase [Phytomonospora endophytica]GIG65819.1 putative amidase AmiB2 [Phytomonospora endophytica]
MSWAATTARQIARAVRRGDATAGAVVDQHMRHAATVVSGRYGDPYSRLRGVDALAEAATVDDLPDLGSLALAGVPVAVSEQLAVAGQSTKHGSAAAGTAIADADHEAVRRLRGAGAVIAGTTKVAELGLWSTSDGLRNPWRDDRGVGGAEGGAVAAVAYGTVPVAVGVDALGGIRVPAAASGVIGFKPGRGVLPALSGAGDWFGLATPAIAGTTVGDVAAVFGVLAGQSVKPGGGEYEPTAPGRLRIAVTASPPLAGKHTDRAEWEALRQIIRLLTNGGHDAHRAAFTLPPTAYGAIFSAWTATAYLSSLRLDKGRLERRTRRHASIGQRVYLNGLLASMDGWRRRASEWFGQESFDVLVTPALPGPAPVDERWSVRSWRSNLAASTRMNTFTSAWNLTGLPALVLPTGARGDGLPSAVQLVGPPGSEGTLLGLADELAGGLGLRRYAGWVVG